MSFEFSGEQVDLTAHAYFSGIKSDLQKYGGIVVDREKPLRRSPEFATAVFDQVALILARSYSNCELDYETADMLANAFQGALLDLIMDFWPAGDGGPYPMQWSLVYEAFDAGEFDHFGRSSNPVAEFTDPMIAEFLAKQD
ncbi:MAG: hypothetical protein WA918_09740 [Erythrobacter sp.]